VSVCCHASRSCRALAAIGAGELVLARPVWQSRRSDDCGATRRPGRQERSCSGVAGNAPGTPLLWALVLVVLCVYLLFAMIPAGRAGRSHVTHAGLSGASGREKGGGGRSPSANFAGCVSLVLYGLPQASPERDDPEQFMARRNVIGWRWRHLPAPPWAPTVPEGQFFLLVREMTTMSGPGSYFFRPYNYGPSIHSRFT